MNAIANSAAAASNGSLTSRQEQARMSKNEARVSKNDARVRYCFP